MWSHISRHFPSSDITPACTYLFYQFSFSVKAGQHPSDQNRRVVDNDLPLLNIRRYPRRNCRLSHKDYCLRFLCTIKKYFPFTMTGTDPNMQSTSTLSSFAPPSTTPLLYSVAENIRSISSPPSDTFPSRWVEEYPATKRTVSVRSFTYFSLPWPISAICCPYDCAQRAAYIAKLSKIMQYLLITVPSSEFLPLLHDDVVYAHSTHCATFASAGEHFEFTDHYCRGSILTSAPSLASKNI